MDKIKENLENRAKIKDNSKNMDKIWRIERG